MRFSHCIDVFSRDEYVVWSWFGIIVRIEAFCRRFHVLDKWVCIWAMLFEESVE
jgi:hypothetical protein